MLIQEEVTGSTSVVHQATMVKQIVLGSNYSFIRGF
jgi:hypothetical protein